MRFITAILTLASMFGTAASLGAQDTAAPDLEQQDAQSQPYSDGSPGQDQQAEQQRAVARLSIAQGDVNVKRGDSGDLVAAVVNAPLLVQDHVQTSAGSRAEVQLDYANMIRLAPNTDIGFADLAYHRYQLQLGAGSIIYRVLRDSDAQAEIDTPSVAVRPTQQGDYRISVLDDGSTEITVRSGELDVYSPKGTEQLQAGRTMLVRGDSSDPEFQMADQPALDQFDEWSANRDRTLLASQSYQHVSRDIYGADDLDAYGNWVPSQYGNVWAPRSVGADWAPYSTGHWVWEDYYGWTWVDDAPWGWAPYHYGRWFDNPGYGWCWWPGSVGSSYFWSPALVGFFGWGGGGFSVGFGVGWGSIGWVALAPFETFHPWWGHGFYGRGFGGGYGNYTNININNVNIVRNTNITNIYRNASKKGAVMTTHGSDFGHGGSARFGRATPVQLRNANLFRGRVPVTPTQASRQFTTRHATPNPRLAAVANRRFYQSPQFAQSARASSARQQMRTQPGSRVAVNASQTGRAGGFTRAGQPASNGVQREAQRGQAPTMSRGSAPRTLQNSRTTGSISAAPQQSFHGMPPNTRSQPGGRSNLGPSQASASGWHRFGETGAQRGQAPAMSRNSEARAPQNSGNRANVGSAPRESFHGMPPNMRSQTGGRSSFSPSTQSSAAGWHRFGEPGTSTGPRSIAQPREQSGWHSFGQPERAGSASYGGARAGNAQAQPRYSRSLNAPNSMPNYGGNYQSRPLGANSPAARPPQSSFGYRGGSSYSPRPSYAAPNYGGMGSSHSAPSMPRYSAPSAPRYSAPAAPRYSAPSAPHYSAPSMPHYSAPSPRGGGGGGFHGSAPSGGGSRGGHSSSDGRRSR
jgi:FecR protein